MFIIVQRHRFQYTERHNIAGHLRMSQSQAVQLAKNSHGLCSSTCTVLRLSKGQHPEANAGTVCGYEPFAICREVSLLSGQMETLQVPLCRYTRLRDAAFR